jgi:cytochrome c biogenesis protein CcmG/thiol:disulfide interchange protein DsbE
MKRAAAVVLAVLLLVAGCGKDLNKPGRDQDARLPDITLNGFDGRPAVDLGTLKGPVVVNLWASWCGPCKRELPIYANFARAYAGRISVLGVDWQETIDSNARSLVARSKVSYPLVTDPNGKLRAIGLPKIILIDANGKIAYQEYVEIKSAGQLEDLVSTHLGVTRP